MRKIKSFGFLAILAIALLASNTADARKKDRGNNYIDNGHLYVWYNGDYTDMGPYHP